MWVIGKMCMIKLGQMRMTGSFLEPLPQFKRGVLSKASCQLDNLEKYPQGTHNGSKIKSAFITMAYLLISFTGLSGCAISIDIRNMLYYYM
uniref:Uncharacterized protein n=1 Tax=Anguilla anguilla TaxID=7936 RepID=A0A0E9WXD6_ANGAN